jgi:insulysin
LRATRPFRVLSHLLGHESPGSLHHLLNSMGYIMGLTSGTAIDTSDFSLFSLTVGLTPKGMKEKDKVLDLIFQWIALIKKTALEQPDLLAKYHEELRQISENNFKFQENGDPTDFCSSVADVMFDEVPPSELLYSGVQCGDYDPVISKAFMERLRPENCMVTITDSGLTKDDNSSGEWKKEPLYGATYRETELSAEQMQAWEDPSEVHPALHVPALNGYIPTDFSLRCDDDHAMSEEEREASRIEYPNLLQESKNFRMWHKKDCFWRVPKTFIRLSLISPHAYESPRAMTLSRIYQRVLNNDLNSFVYDASIAGCNYRYVQYACEKTWSISRR